MSRTTKTLKNAKYSLVFMILILGLNFFSRNIFLQNLGSELLGLNTVANNLIGLLNLAELGIVSAISASLFKPIEENDRKTIIDIISLQGWLYRKVAIFIFISSLVLMLFFSSIFAKENIPSTYPYIVFSVFLFNTLLGYLFNYIQIMLFADMKGYQITLIVQGVSILKVIFQVIIVILFHNAYFYWLAIEMLSTLLITFFIQRAIRTNYPWLSLQISEGRWLINKYPEVFLRIKQIFFHKIAGVVQFQSIPIIIYSYTNLIQLTKYSNYMVIITGLSTIFNVLLQNLQAAVGNLVAQGHKEAQLKFLDQYLSIIYFICGFIALILYHQTDNFISLWIGKEFILEQTILVVIIINFSFSLVRSFDLFSYAYGLFHDIWAAIVETLICIGFSIILGKHWGLVGVLLGSTLGYLVIPYIWRPYFIYTQGFKVSPLLYVKTISYLLPAMFISIFSSHYFISMTLHIEQNSIWDWILYSCYISVVYFIFAGVIFMLLSPHFRQALLRIKQIILTR